MRHDVGLDALAENLPKAAIPAEVKNSWTAAIELTSCINQYRVVLDPMF
jgi:hypothetical protein